jgi:hypothetical protein
MNKKNNLKNLTNLLRNNMVKRGLQNVKSLRKVLNPSNLAFSFNKHDLKNNIKEVRIQYYKKW